MRSTKVRVSVAVAGFLALLATIAYAAGFDQFNSGYVKIGNGTTGNKTLEMNVGNTTNDPMLIGDSSNNMLLSATSLRFLERPAGGVNYVELNVPAALSGNVAFTLPTAAAGVNGAVLTATTAGIMSFVSPLPIANGGTNGATKAAAFDSLSPMSAAGDLIYGGTSGTGTRVAAGSATQLLHSGTTPSWSAVSMTADVTGTLPLGNGGTGATSKSTAFDALSPMTTNGDVIVGGASGTGTRTACATANTVLRGGTPAACGSLVNADIPTTLTGKTLSGNTATNLVSGSGTLTLNTSGTITVPNGTSTLAVTNANNSFSASQTITGSSGTTLTLSGVSNQDTISVANTAAAGSSYGIVTTAGGNTSDYSMLLRDRAGTNLFKVDGAGHAQVLQNGGNIAHNCRQVSTTSTGTSVSTTCGNPGEIVMGGGCLCSSASGLRNSYYTSSTTWGCDWNASCASNQAFGICCAF